MEADTYEVKQKQLTKLAREEKTQVGKNFGSCRMITKNLQSRDLDGGPEEDLTDGQ